MKHLLCTLLICIAINVSVISKSEAALSWMSRANCATLNESITWDPLSYHWIWTYTEHSIDYEFEHGWNNGWQWTWRSYAGHSEGTDDWSVKGNHYRYTARQMIHLDWTYAYNCNLGEW